MYYGTLEKFMYIEFFQLIWLLLTITMLAIVGLYQPIQSNKRNSITYL